MNRLTIKKLVLCFSFICIHSVHSEKSNVLVNENLLLNLPFPSGEWTVSHDMNEDLNILETRWNSNTSDDIVQNFIEYKRPNADVKKSKVIDNAIGRDNCDKLFESDVISDEIQGGYQQLTWYTVCKTSDGFYSKAIHKSIAGNDSSYAFKAIFKSEPSRFKWKLWTDYVKKIRVCDSRLAEQGCPQDLNRIL